MKLFLKLIPIIFLLIAFLLISIWFNQGDLLATGEDGLILYNPARSLQLYNSSWTEIGTGMTGSIFRPLVPLTYFQLKVQALGISTIEFQKILFFILLATGMISSYYLTLELLKIEIDSKKIYLAAFLAGLFYIFNPISMLGVWYRFIYTFMFLYAIIPLFFLLFIKGLKTNKFRYTILLALITIPFCYAFGSPAMIPLLWVLPIIYTLLYTLQSKQYFPILFLLISLVLFLLVNLWWIIPMKGYFTNFSSLSSTNDIVYNINTLKSNSGDFTVDNVIRLIHGGFLYRGEGFGPIYKSLPFVFLSWILPIIALVGILKCRDRFTKRFLFISIIILIFLAKGTSFPLGTIQIFLFKVLSPMQLYRNPIEKWGLLLPTIFMLAFAIGFIKLLSLLKSKLKIATLFIILMGYLFVFHWPLLTGNIVQYKDRRIAVQVPQSFEEANKILGSTHRLLSFPMIGGASGQYSWNKPFSGHEASEYLFDSPTISKAFGGDSYSELFVKLSNDISISPVTKAQVFGSDILVLRKDLNLKRLELPSDATKKSQEVMIASNLKQILDFPEFSLWETPQEKRVPMISSFSSVIFVQSIDSFLDLLKQNKIDLQKSVYICEGNTCIPNVSIKREKFEGMVNPEKLTYTKVSPSSYKVKISGNKGKFILTLLQSYHYKWKFRVNGNQLDESNHFVVNGFGNGFIIDQKGEDLDIDIFFLSEDIYNNLYKVSGIVIILLLGLLSLIILKDSLVPTHNKISNN